MKKAYLILVFAFWTALIQSQTYQITFAVLGGNEEPENVKVENLTQSTEQILKGSDILLLTNEITGVNEHLTENRLDLRVYPNPTDKTATLEFFNAKRGLVKISIYSIDGKKILQFDDQLPRGDVAWQISGLQKGTYVANVYANNVKSSTIIISKLEQVSSQSVTLQTTLSSGNNIIKNSYLKGVKSFTSDTVKMQYNSGDILKFTAVLHSSEDVIDNYVASKSESIFFGFTYKVTFIVTDGTDPIKNASIEIHGQTIITDENGLATIDLPKGEYLYSISTIGYNDVSDGSITINYQAVNLPITLTKNVYPVTFTVTFGLDLVENASIEIDGQTLITDAGGMATIDMPNGNYLYSISAIGYGSISDSTIIVNNQAVNESIDLEKALYPITFTVTNGIDPIENARISIAGQRLYTNTEGIASINLLNGDYPYLIPISGYSLIRDTITVNKQPENVLVVASVRQYKVTFTVTNGTDPVANASIEINGQSLETDASGTAVIDLPNGDYTYSISVTGYEDITDGSITINNQFVNESVILTEIQYPVTFTVTDGSTPIENASISINGQTISTDASGLATINLGIGIYPYSISASGYGDITDGNITVSNQAVNESVAMPPPPVTDINGNVYRTVKIGNQTWMAENLRTTKLKDGSNITLKTTNASWTNSIPTPAYCWYNNDNTFAESKNYGALYNWHAVNTGKLCPSGWHVPSINEFSTFMDNVIGNGTEGWKLKAIEGWVSYPGIFSDDSYGFTALPAGFRTSSDASFRNAGSFGYWWTSSVASDYHAHRFYMSYNSSVVVLISEGMWSGSSVRCIKD